MAGGGGLGDDLVAGGVGPASVETVEQAGAIFRGRPDCGPTVVGGTMIAEGNEAVDVAGA